MRMRGLNGERVLIGGVGYWWQRDASFGVVAAQTLAQQAWPPEVEVDDLGYGAHFVVQDLQAADPPYDRLILIAGVQRGRMPGRLYRCGWSRRLPDPEEIQARIREAGAGVVDLDHLLIIAEYFEALPENVLLLEVEPIDVASGDGLTPAVAALIDEVESSIRRELAFHPAETP